ncbi:MAG: hypothetical protein N4A45_06850 [Flavobacteriales bacterium]|jgi:hypothetical protein|nr:hypothetical protein [Flavobacteriales bacterium]
MIYINPLNRCNKIAFEIHKDNLSDFVKNKVKDLGENCEIKNEVKRLLTPDRISLLISSQPNDLLLQNEKFYEDIVGYDINGYNQYKENLKIKKNDELSSELISNRETYKKLHQILNEVFNYNSFVMKKGQNSYDGYQLAKNLGVQTCVYCNRLYTKTVIKDFILKKKNKITRPEFDHWFPKSKYPLLALSFYNLIPSCHICNSNLKGDDDMSLDDYLHPYLDKESFDKIKFSYVYKNSIGERTFEIQPNILDNENKKIIKTIESFKLKEVYEAHLDELNDLVALRDKYSDRYLDNLQSILTNSSNVSKNEIYRMAFGVYSEEGDFHRRPLSKMKKDILTELGVIKEDDYKSYD